MGVMSILKPPRPDRRGGKMEWERKKDGPKVMPDFSQMVKYIKDKVSTRGGHQGGNEYIETSQTRQEGWQNGVGKEEGRAKGHARFFTDGEIH